MMKDYLGNKRKFSGGWQEDVDVCFAIFETMAHMFHLTPTEKLEAVPVMLDGDALRQFLDKGGGSLTYKVATDLLTRHYDSQEKKPRILATCNPCVSRKNWRTTLN